MIQLIEALNFRCLRYVKQSLGPFHVLVGPNASGKTTFLDVVSFLGRIVADGVDAAIGERTENFQDLVWQRGANHIELAIEAAIPNDRKEKLQKPFDAIRYEIKIGIDETTGEVGIEEEKAWLKPRHQAPIKEHLLFPVEPDPPQSVLTGKVKTGWQSVLSKAQGGNDNFHVEVRESSKGKGWFPSIRLGPRKSALGNLPEDETKFPVSTWLKDLLVRGVQSFVLNSLLIRKASPPNRAPAFKPDGSNLPWVVKSLSKDKKRFESWVSHVRTSLTDLLTAALKIKVRHS